MKGLTSGKKLEEMSNEELWQLFPIVLCDHNPQWIDEYLSESTHLNQIVGTDLVRITHIGSTSVPGLIAKPTIDILLEIENETDLHKLKSKIEDSGYIYSAQPNNSSPHMMFMKGYTPQGFQGQAFHLHVRYLGDWNERYFCKYLMTHPEAVEEYGKLKKKLEEKYKHDRDAYTNAKTEFILRITELARKELSVGE